MDTDETRLDRRRVLSGTAATLLGVALAGCGAPEGEDEGEDDEDGGGDEEDGGEDEADGGEDEADEQLQSP